MGHVVDGEAVSVREAANIRLLLWDGPAAGAKVARLLLIGSTQAQREQTCSPFLFWPASLPLVAWLQGSNREQQAKQKWDSQGLRPPSQSSVSRIGMELRSQNLKLLLDTAAWEILAF